MKHSRIISFFPSLIVTSIAFALVATGACTDAKGDVSGGEPLFDAFAPDVGNVDQGLGTGTNFSDLYNDYFSATGRASCAGNGQCHGGAGQAGAQASGGYVCTDVDTCRTTMMQFILVDPSTRASTCGQPFSDSYMYSVIRKTSEKTGEDNMPLSPFTYSFSDTSLARINTWVTGGCLDN
jgi:hypothetical protein